MSQHAGVDHLDDASYARLRRAASTDRCRLVVRLCGEVGLRPAEITRLSPDDTATRVRNGTVHHFLAVRDADCAHVRDAYLPRDVKRALDRYIEREGRDGTASVFDVSPRRLQMLVGEAVDEAIDDGFDSLRGVSTADLRRYHARSLLRRGVPPAVVMAVGGWRRLDGFVGDPESVGRETAAVAISRADSGGDDRFRAAFDRLDQPALLFDDAGVVDRVNDRFAAVTGWDREHAGGRELRDIAALLGGHAYADLWEATLNGGTWRGPVACRRPDNDPVEGELTLAAVGNPTRPDGFVATLRIVDDAPSAGDRLSAVQSRVLAAGDALASASTRESVLSQVCNALADGEAYRGAWAFDAPVEEQALSTAAGAASLPEDADALAAAAVADSTVTADDETAALAVPLSHDADHGALVLVPTGPVDEPERRALAGLGGWVGGTLAAVEWKRLLLADAVLELELELSTRNADSLFAALSAELGCELTVEGLVPLDGDSLLYYVSVGDVPAETALEVADETAESARLVAAASDASLLEVTADGDSVPGVLITRGANVSALTADCGTVELTCETAPSADVRDLVEGVRETYPGTRLVAKREIERSVRAPTEFQQALAERLTDKQRSVLQVAYHAGYFDWPRGSTAEELADSIDVSSPTLHNHLRRAQRKLLAAFFDGDG